MFATVEPEASVITLSQIGSLDKYQTVIIDVKVFSTTEPVYLSGGKKKQDVMIGDQSGTSKVTLWEEHVDSLVLQAQKLRSSRIHIT